MNHSLLDIGKVLSSEHEFRTLSSLIISKAKKLLKADRCSIIFRNHDTDHLYTNMTDGSKTEFVIPDESIAGKVAHTGKGINVVDAYQNQDFNPEFDEKSGRAQCFQEYCLLCRLEIPNQKASSLNAALDISSVFNFKFGMSAVQKGTELAEFSANQYLGPISKSLE